MLISKCWSVARAQCLGLHSVKFDVLVIPSHDGQGAAMPACLLAAGCCLGRRPPHSDAPADTTSQRLHHLQGHRRSTHPSFTVWCATVSVWSMGLRSTTSTTSPSSDTPDTVHRDHLRLSRLYTSTCNTRGSTVRRHSGGRAVVEVPWNSQGCLRWCHSPCTSPAPRAVP